MSIIKKRTEWSHKYDFGHLLVIGGNWKYSGSPAFNALAALRTGVDLVTVVAPERAANIVATFSPDLITVPLQGNFLNEHHLDLIMDIAKNEKVSAIVIGGGCGRSPETFHAIRSLHQSLDLPFVLDADALHAIALGDFTLRKNDVLTPHGGEFKALFNVQPSTKISERKKQVADCAKKSQAIVLLKGWVDIVSDGKRTNAIAKNKDCVYMTKGGTGDVLAGIVGSLIAQGAPSFDAACAAAKINGLAGAAVGKQKRAGLLASDLLEKLPDALKKIKI